MCAVDLVFPYSVAFYNRPLSKQTLSAFIYTTHRVRLAMTAILQLASYSEFCIHTLYHMGRTVAWWLHYATGRQVAGSIPDDLNGIFQWYDPSGRTMALGSTQPLTEMSTRCISWG